MFLPSHPAFPSAESVLQGLPETSAPPLLGQMLLGQGVLSKDQLHIALLEQEKSLNPTEPIGKILVRLGFISEAALRDMLSENQGKGCVDLSHAAVCPAALAKIPRQIAERYHIMPLDYAEEERHLSLAMADINNLNTLDRVRMLFPGDIRIETFLAGESEINQAIDRYYGHELTIDGILQEIEAGKSDREAGQNAHEYSQPVARLMEAILIDAVKQEASDIHFEPEQNFLRIRYRQDGILRQIRVLHLSYWPAMVVRLKVIGHMDIAETRAPQDGHLSLSISGRPVDFRLACQPTLHGENIVVRILDRQKGLVKLEELGLSENLLPELKRVLARPEGILLVTGPTGSGKTTTLYSILNDLNSEHIHIMTLEDPVEYPMPLVRQTSVNEAIKLDFVNGIRSMMRQDPDVILIGEIRDAPTASMALRAAMTGHQVFATLHTSSAIGAIPRLTDIGMTPDILAGNIIGIVAQRLVRRLCAHCKAPARASPKECHLLGLDGSENAPSLYRAKGCRHCHFTGYRGRLAIMELLRIDRELDDLIAKNASRNEIFLHALSRGFRPLAEDGAKRVLEGMTSLEELIRVVDLSERM